MHKSNVLTAFHANTANGVSALYLNTTGNNNTAIGFQALNNSITGDFNTALGAHAGYNITTAGHVICIGAYLPGANVSGSCFIGNIRGVTTQNADAIPVLIAGSGQLGTKSSSRRFKKEIKPMASASETILALEPVTFQYKSDTTATAQFGLVAEEVAKIDPNLVVRDGKGDIYSVRYDAVNAMLLNEFLKEHRAFVEEQHKVEKLEATVTSLVATIKEQAAQIQKVSARLEVSQPAAQALANKQ